jgi:hypothetical protein
VRVEAKFPENVLHADIFESLNNLSPNKF